MAKKRQHKKAKGFNFKKLKNIQVDPEKVYIPEMNFAWFDDEEETAEAESETVETAVATTDELSAEKMAESENDADEGSETAAAPTTDNNPTDEEEEEREDAYVIVHPMTVRDKSILGTYTNQLGLSEISSECIIAALTSRDDDGHLVWGESRHKAIEFLSSLPEQLRPVITRIAQKALELTGDQGSKAIKEAKKN